MAPSKKKTGIRIIGVLPGSIGEAAGILKGDRLYSINDHAIGDPIDYRYYESEELVVLHLLRQGVSRVLSITKETDEDLGLELHEPRYRTCRNNCIFCFVHQMPSGLRSSLYVKDDDYRLSFTHGNYITLTNLTEPDYSRIVGQRLSPLYVSVHATDDRARRKILGNPDAPPILPAMKRLLSDGIHLHIQIVLCPGINDGKVFERSVKDLMDLPPGIESVAVVPVGLTRHRKNLEPLEPISKEYAMLTVDLVHGLQQGCVKQFGNPWIFASDEFYLTSGQPFPPLGSYGDFPQLENGVGMVPLFKDGVDKGLDRLPLQESAGRFIIGTGVLAHLVLKPLVEKISIQTGCRVDLVPIRNHFFGDSVTVSGLLTGHDLIRTFLDYPAAGPLVLPSNMLRSGDTAFLDGMTVRQVEKKLGRRLNFPAGTPEGLLSLFKNSKIT